MSLRRGSGGTAVARQLAPAASPSPRPCSVEGCDRSRYQQLSICSAHRNRRDRYGDYLTWWPVGDRAAREQDIDELAVQRAVDGDPPAHLYPWERRAAVAQLTEAGLSVRLIAERLRVTERTVERHRARIREAS